MVQNHYGYGLRTDEKPFAHKIPPGGNWKSLPREDQLVFWNGRIPTDGGNTNGLRRKDWDEPAGTITSQPIQKLSCQLHPSYGYPDNDLERKEYMEYNVTPTQPQNGYTIAELFCGGGLMAVGLKESGFSIIWANDFDKRAVEAYRHNFGDHVVLGDITQIDPDDIPDVDVIAGGPPCQDYSVAGKGLGADGERGKLVFTYLDIIAKKRPKAFIFENVKGLIGKKHRPTFDALLAKFDEIGYKVSWKLINAWDYGVAQKRERIFIVGIRKDLGFTYEFPEPDPADYRTQVLRDVIGDLPDPNTGINGHIQTPSTTVKATNKLSNQRSYTADWDKPARTVNTCRLDHAEIHPGPQNHNPKPLTDGEVAYLERNPDTVRKHRPVTEDEPSRTLPANLSKGVPYGLYQPKNHDEESYWTPKSEYNFDQANRVQSWDKPSNTIPAHHNSGQPQHPTQAPRRFTVRECLRIQSAPDWYVLPDGISLSAQYRIVGNGVPCRVAWYLGKALAEQLRQAEGGRVNERSGFERQAHRTYATVG